jgi:hypothetical protein
MTKNRRLILAATASALLFALAIAPLTIGKTAYVGSAKAASGPAAAASQGVGANPHPFTLDDLFARVAHSEPGFGGMFLAKDGSLEVYLLDPGQKHAAVKAIRTVFGRKTVDRPLHVLHANYSFLRLKQWHDRHRIGTLAIPGVVLTGIDEGKNRLQVGVVSHAAAERVTRRLRRLGVPLDAVAISRVKPITPASDPTLQDTRRPLEGGLQISNGSGFCSIGTLAVRQNVAGFVTASHCTAIQGGVEGTVFHQATPSGVTNRIGIEAVDPPYSSGGDCPSGRVCRLSDSAFVRRDGGPSQMTPRASAKFGYIAAPNFNSLAVGDDKFHLTGVGLFPLEGQYLAKVGRTTGLTGGDVTDTCDDINESGKPVTLFCQYRVAAPADHGDSGSPVFDWNSATLPPGAYPPATLYGILWGVDPDHFAFSPIGAVDAELGIGLSGFYPQSGSANSQPEVKIRNPLDGASVGIGGLNNVQFQADAVDYEDPSVAITWTSDKDGTIGYGPALDYVFSTPGTRKVTAIAKDNNGAVATDSITITAINAPPQAVISKPAPGQTLYRGIPYVFEGHATDYNEFAFELPCSSLHWTSSNGGDLSFPASGCQPPITFATNGTRTILLTGTDSFGLKTTASVTVSVVNPPANSPPIVTILNPPDNAYLLAGDTVTLKGTATDPDNKNPLIYTWVLKRGSTLTTLGTGSVNNGQQISLPWTPGMNVPVSCGGEPIQVYLYVKDPDGMTGSNFIDAFVSYPVC